MLKYPSDAKLSAQHGAGLWQELLNRGLSDIPGFMIESLSPRHDAVLNGVGLVAADYFLVTAIKGMLAGSTAPDCMDLSEDEAMAREHRLEALKIQVAITDSQFAESFCQQEKEVSSKLRKFLDVIAEHKSESFCAIVFVEQRQVAVMLAWAMSLHSETKGWIRCAVLTGHGDKATSGESIHGMTLSAQRDVVSALRNGRVNLRTWITDVYRTKLNM